MAGDALFLGWGPVVRGRESRALDVFQETISYYGKLQQEGMIESFEPILLNPHGGDLAGFVLIRGERAALNEIGASADFRKLVVKAGSVVDDVGVIAAFGGEALAQQMGVFRTVSEELAS
jgi:hypothetical protein